MEASRDDAGKARVDLIDPAFVLGMGDVMAMGSLKYDDDNWKLDCGTERHHEYRQKCYACLLRHTLALNSGEVYDEESGKHHAYHVACNAMFIAYYDTMGGKV